MELADRLADIQQRMAAACTRAGRAVDAVQLLAVSKTHPPETVDKAIDLGLTLFGENRVQEAKAKIPRCSSRATWHMIGHLQSNKVRDAVELFSMIEGVDSLRIAQEISNRAGQADKTLPLLLEVNVGGEASKSGYAPEALLAEVKKLAALPNISVRGLMTVPPWKPMADQVRPFFAKARELKEQCEQILGNPLPHLSMGMSGDFEVAIEEGATLIRVGTALFGERKKILRPQE
jgi:pyridoxal phosphate enzyme (YggS family)